MRARPEMMRFGWHIINDWELTLASHCDWGLDVLLFASAESILGERIKVSKSRISTLVFLAPEIKRS
jgi:hypothetical protein